MVILHETDPGTFDRLIQPALRSDREGVPVMSGGIARIERKPPLEFFVRRCPFEPGSMVEPQGDVRLRKIGIDH